MSSYQFTPQAVEDLFEIWSYIANDDLDAANRIDDAVQAACAFLAETPRAGSVREDWTALPLRFWLVKPYRSYWIVYDPETKPLRVIDHPCGSEYSAHIEVEQGKVTSRRHRQTPHPW